MVAVEIIVICIVPINEIRNFDIRPLMATLLYGSLPLLLLAEIWGCVGALRCAKRNALDRNKSVGEKIMAGIFVTVAVLLALSTVRNVIYWSTAFPPYKMFAALSQREESYRNQPQPSDPLVQLREEIARSKHQ